MRFLNSCLYVIFLGIASHYIGEAVPRKWFNPTKFPYRDWAWEKKGRIYELIKIQNWKDKMPDMSRIMKDMIPKRVSLHPTSAEINALVLETCVAEATHAILMLLAPVIYLFWFSGMGIFLSAVFALGNLPFILIQRYNRPTLIAFAKRLEAREEKRRKNACSDSVG